MRFLAFVLSLAATGLVMANLAWGHGFDGRSFLAVILICLAIIIWACAPARRS